MFGAAYKEVQGLLDKRFTLNALLPAIVFCLGLVAAWEATGEGVTAGVDRLAALGGTATAALAVGGVAVTFVLAVLLSSQSSTLLAWAQGQGGPLGWWFVGAGGKWWWKTRLAGETSTPSFRVPREGEVAPTALGTLGYANSEYLKRVYNVDADVIWPRLSLLVKDDSLTTPLTAAESAMEQCLAFAAIAALLGFVVGGIAAYHRVALVWSVGAPFAGVVLAVVLYRAALPAAERWSHLLRAAIDLHRFELLDALGLPRPKTSGEERVQWGRVNGALMGQDLRALGFAQKKQT